MRVYSSTTLAQDIDSYVGPFGEITVGGDGKLRVHDNNTSGGRPIVGGVVQSPAAPENPDAYTLWYDEVSGRLYVWYDDAWVDASPNGGGSGNVITGGGVVQSENAPNDPTDSTLWFDLSVGRLYVWYDGVWVDAAPAANGGGTADLGKFVFGVDAPSATAVILTTNDAGGTDGYDIVLSPGGESYTSIRVPNTTNTLAGDPVRISNMYENGSVAIETNSGNFTFDSNGNLTFPQGTFLGYSDPGGFIIDGAVDKDIAIYTYSGADAHGWTFGTDGSLTFPSTGKIIADSQDGTYLVANSGVDGYAGITNINYSSWMWTSNDGSAYISASDGYNNNTWTFGRDGWLRFPEINSTGAAICPVDTGINLGTDTGDVSIWPGTSRWTFGEDGKLTLPNTAKLTAVSSDSVTISAPVKNWIAQYGDLTTRTHQDDGNSVAYDSEGNLIVCITDYTDIGYSVPTVVKYSPNGEVLWKVDLLDNTNGVIGSCESVAIDDNNNIYILTNTLEHYTYCSWVVKLSSAGAQLESLQFLPDSGGCDLFDMVLHPFLEDVFYLVGRKTTPRIGVVMKASFSVGIIWQTGFNIDEYTTSDRLVSIAIMNDDPPVLYVCGWARESAPNPSVYVPELIKINSSDGTIEWATALGAGDSFSRFAAAVAVGRAPGEGHLSVYAAISDWDTGGTIIAKYDGYSGALESQIAFDAPPDVRRTTPTSMIFDQDAYALYVVGSVNTQEYYPANWTWAAKFDTDLALQWANDFKHDDSNNQGIYQWNWSGHRAIAVRNGMVAFTGSQSARGTSTPSRAVTCQFSADGTAYDPVVSFDSFSYFTSGRTTSAISLSDSGIITPITVSPGYVDNFNNPSTGSITVSASTASNSTTPVPDAVWVFGSDGTLTVPGRITTPGGTVEHNADGTDLYIGAGPNYGCATTSGSTIIHGGHGDWGGGGPVQIQTGSDAGNPDITQFKYTWEFDSTGLLTFPDGDLTIGTIDNSSILQAADGHGLSLFTSGAEAGSALTWIDSLTEPTQIAALIVNNPLYTGSGDVGIVTGEALGPGSNPNIWNFGADGKLTLPAGGDIRDAVSNISMLKTQIGDRHATSSDIHQLTIAHDEGKLITIAGSGVGVFRLPQMTADMLGAEFEFYFDIDAGQVHIQSYYTGVRATTDVFRGSIYVGVDNATTGKLHNATATTSTACDLFLGQHHAKAGSYIKVKAIAFDTVGTWLFQGMCIGDTGQTPNSSDHPFQDYN